MLLNVWPARQRPPANAAVATLDDTLVSGLQLSSTSRKEFLETGWKVPCATASNDDSSDELDFYFHYYDQCCSNAPSTLRSCSHKHVCSTMQQLKGGTRKECEDALLQLLPTSATTVVAAQLVEFVGRAALCLDLRTWDPTETLPQFVSRTRSVRSAQKDDFRLSRSFNARTLAKVAGINVQWTRDLAEHLEVKGNDSDIAIFHCVSVLDLYEQSALGKVFPTDFLEETRRTLSLLIPTSVDRPTKSWFDSERRKRMIDPRCGSCRHLKASERHLHDFNFWRDRIIIAKEVFDEHQPKGILQVWRDNRNPVQWWTFWIALIVFALTVIACVEGALQVYKAYNPSS